jgi:prepilin-type N-terminal cleavage/methylation domain-containing protein
MKIKHKRFTSHLLRIGAGRQKNKEFLKSAGFTLRELLVVVAIIGLLVAISTISVAKIKTRKQDVHRVSDIKSIQEALAMYHNDFQLYPIYDGYITGSDYMSNELISNGAIRQVPTDPVNLGDYQYYYQSVDGSDYLIEYHLETDSIEGKSQGLNTSIP